MHMWCNVSLDAELLQVDYLFNSFSHKFCLAPAKINWLHTWSRGTCDFILKVESIIIFLLKSRYFQYFVDVDGRCHLCPRVSISEISHLDKKLHIRRMDDTPALMPLFAPLMTPGGMAIAILLGSFYTDHFLVTWYRWRSIRGGIPRHLEISAKICIFVYLWRYTEVLAA